MRQEQGHEDRERIDNAACEIGLALTKTLGDMQPLLEQKFGLDASQASLAICHGVFMQAGGMAATAAGLEGERANAMAGKVVAVIDEMIKRVRDAS